MASHPVELQPTAPSALETTGAFAFEFAMDVHK